MNKKSTILVFVFLFFILGTSVLFSSFRPPVTTTKHGFHGPSKVLYSYRVPPGSTGFIPTLNCSNNTTPTILSCHNSFAVNAGNGSVSVSGLPAFYIPNQTYTFNVKISSTAASRKSWGFSIIAKKQDGTSIGTFDGSLNDSADIQGDELCHGDTTTFKYAQNVPVATEYTYTNLRWKAPPSDQGQVTFYYAGVAGNYTPPPPANETGDYVYTGSTIVGTLPITLTSFDAAIKNNNNVSLTWQTAQELNSDYFEVQRSLDGNQFVAIGKVPATGNSSIPRNYSFTDSKATYYEHPVYYRLSMVDKDGSHKFSSVKNIILKATATFLKNIYPNPVISGGLLHFTLVSKENEAITATLIDINGKTVKNITPNVIKGNNLLEMKLPALAAGNYKLIIKSSNGMIEEPVMTY